MKNQVAVIQAFILSGRIVFERLEKVTVVFKKTLDVFEKTLDVFKNSS